MPLIAMRTLLCLFLCFSFAGAAPEGFPAASAEVRADLEAALDQLSATRERIAAEQIELSREVNLLEDEVLAASREVERLERQVDNRTVGVNALTAEVESRRNEIEYITGLLNEFVRDFESRIDVSELGLYDNALREARLATEEVDLDEAAKLARQMEIVEIAVDRIGEIAGGMRYEGKALTDDGVVEEGTFAAIGPTVFFRSDSGAAVGLALPEINDVLPAIVALPEGFREDIAELVSTGEGTMPADATLGNALKMERTRSTLVEHIAKGGLWAYVILGLGAVAAALAVFKIGDIGAVRLPRANVIEAMLQDLEEGREEAASAKAAALPGRAGRVFQDAVANAGRRRSVLEEILFARLLEVRPPLERFLPFLALVAAAAPLLGLLGTVTGMIKTFNLISVFGTGDAQKLSTGISEALVTTELGLAVAIPALIIHGLLNRMSKRKMADLEQKAVAFLNGLEPRNGS